MLKVFVSESAIFSMDEDEVYWLGEFDSEECTFFSEDGYGRLAISNILEVNE